MTDTPTGRFSAHFVYGRRQAHPSEAFAFRKALGGDSLDVAALNPPERPEPARFGEGGGDCRDCLADDPEFLWTDPHWRIGTHQQPRAMFFVLLRSRAHYQELTDLPPERISELGPLLQRMEAAMRGLGDVGRVHTHRWGDGGAHFHLWQIIRPEGMTQASGVGLPVWLGSQPPLPEPVWNGACADFARAMARGGGTAHR